MYQEESLIHILWICQGYYGFASYYINAYALCVIASIIRNSELNFRHQN